MDGKINLNTGKKSKTLIIIAVAVMLVIAALAVAGYFYWDWLLRNNALKNLEKNSGSAEKLLEDATKGVLPSLETNPLSNKPDINPASAGNPIKDIRTNPFE